LFVGITKLVPTVRGPFFRAQSTATGRALRDATIVSPRPQRRPVQWIASLAVAEAVNPALGEVVAGVRLHLDGDVLVVGLLTLGRAEVVVVARFGVRELLGSCLGVGERRLRNTAFRCACHQSS